MVQSGDLLVVQRVVPRLDVTDLAGEEVGDPGGEGGRAVGNRLAGADQRNARKRRAMRGRAVTGDAESYRYLVESIRKFPKPNVFADMISAAGFARVNWQSLSGGIVALHSDWRL